MLVADPQTLPQYKLYSAVQNTLPAARDTETAGDAVRDRTNSKHTVAEDAPVGAADK